MSAAYPAGTVFLDANVFLHNVFAHRLYQTYCRTLLRKVEAGEIDGVTSSRKAWSWASSTDCCLTMLFT